MKDYESKAIEDIFGSVVDIYNISLDEFNVFYEKAKERNKNDFDKLAQLEVISKAVKLRDNLHVKINVFDLLRNELKGLDSLVLKSTTKASPTEHREVHIKAKGFDEPFYHKGNLFLNKSFHNRNQYYNDELFVHEDELIAAMDKWTREFKGKVVTVDGKILNLEEIQKLVKSSLQKIKITEMKKKSGISSYMHQAHIYDQSSGKFSPNGFLNYGKSLGADYIPNGVYVNSEAVIRLLKEETPKLPIVVKRQLPAVIKKQLPAVVEEKKPTPNPTPDPIPIPKEERKTLQQIMYELQKGLEIKAKSGKRYQAANIKVAKNFKNELKSGNVWYNVVHFGPTLIKSAVAGIKKSAGKFNLWRTEQTHTMEVLKERIDNLSDNDLQVIWEEYRGSQVNQDSFTSALNNMLNDRIQQFANKKVSEINTKIAAGYNQIFGDYQIIKVINKQLENSEISADQRKQLEARKQALLNTKAQDIGNLRKLYIQGNNYYSGGAHGFSEDMKAAGTNLSKVGKRFAVKHDYDDELQARKAKLEMIEANAVRNGDNEQALEAFIQYEGLKSDETEINRSILRGGDRSTGKMYYSPLVGQLDYRDDPFIRDVFTTIAMVGAAVSVANSIHTHVTETNKVLAEQQAKVDQVNGTNQSTIDQVHQTGQDIANHRDTFNKGMEAQANSDAINTLNVGERGASDASVNSGGGWSSGSVYREADEIAHATAKKAYETSQQQIQDIAAQYSQGILSQAQVTEKLAEMATTSHQTLQGVIQNSLPHFQAYMQNHPQFELAEVGKAMDYLVQNPNAISDMYQGMVDVTNMGESLTGLTIEQVEALQSLPSDMFTTLMGAASSAALAYNCAKSTSKNRSSAKSEQEQQIIDMVSEYQASHRISNEGKEKAA